MLTPQLDPRLDHSERPQPRREYANDVSGRQDIVDQSSALSSVKRERLHVARHFWPRIIDAVANYRPPVGASGDCLPLAGSCAGGRAARLLPQSNGAVLQRPMWRVWPPDVEHRRIDGVSLTAAAIRALYAE